MQGSVRKYFFILLDLEKVQFVLLLFNEPETHGQPHLTNFKREDSGYLLHYQADRGVTGNILIWTTHSITNGGVLEIRS